MRTRVTLPAGCVTLVAFGGDGVLDLDATLLDARGAPIAHDTTAEPQAVLHACVDVADTYTVVVKTAAIGRRLRGSSRPGRAAPRRAAPLALPSPARPLHAAPATRRCPSLSER